MIFLGNDKYFDKEGESGFDKFVSQNGGSTNAYTDMEDTNYYFNVAPLDHESASVSDEGEDISNNGSSSSSKGEASLALQGALDRFAQFFISPLFNEDSVERELRAIDSEYLNAMTSESWRNYSLLKYSSNQEHPFSKFGCGNYNTLTNGGKLSTDTASTAAEANNGDTVESDAASSGGSSPRDDLIQFWESKYVAENMKICVVGKADLDELQRIVEVSFSNVRTHQNKDGHENTTVDAKTKEHTNDKLFKTEHSKYGIAAFGQDQLGILREYIPLVEERSIKLLFAVPPSDDPLIREYRPDRVLSHLIGHESPGSLHDLLCEENLINDLSSGSGVNTADFSLFSITLQLTPKGMAQRDYVLSLLWKWMNLIRNAVYEEKELMEKYHDELRQISKTHFQFRENGDPTDFCSNAAELLFDYEPENILLGSSCPGPYNDEVVKAFLDRLTPENAILSVVSPDLEKETIENTEHECSAASGTWETEKWYRAKYRDVKITDALKEKWSKGAYEADNRLHLPALNDFLPTDFSLRSEDSTAIESADPNVDYSKEMPKLLVNRPGLQMWHKMDRTFKVPRTSLRMLITTPNTYQSPRSMTLSRLYVKVLADDLNSYIYDANLAGCRARVACIPSGYSISVNGYSEKLPHLLDVVTGRMLSIIGEMKEGSEAKPGLAMKFDKAVENLLKDTKNTKYESPYETASYMSRMLLESNVWHINNYIGELEGEYAEKNPLTMEECAKVAEECLTGRLSAVLLAMGNIDEEGAHNVAQLMNDNFLAQSRPLQQEEIPRILSLKMPTREQAKRIFGPDIGDIPLVIEEVAQSESEENHAVELIIQVGAEHELGFEGVAIVELISQMAYTSAYDQLRTKEQLGYIVSAFSRKTAGSAAGFSVVVQSSTTLPQELEKRCEAWMVSFREQLGSMPAEDIAKEAAAVVAQLMERNMRLADEVATAWGSIVSTSFVGSLYNTPPFDRHIKLAEELKVQGTGSNVSGDAETSMQTAEELKSKLLSIWDKYFDAKSPERKAVSARVYGQKAKAEYEKNIGKTGILSSYEEVRQLKQFLEHYPTAPYWIKKV